ncbi:hypothetical protein VV01_08185 [Luteipulveratus halotolerans]|uniref:DUF881 domain-containing protein n=2 Tax=Luteipulveratus halotolerans TaxID=1631356 RepID=A0A0L6CHZ3_9MICO|nr:hypothetical protein VV01_08185 [Luteipulveratus halotolerans]
MALLTDLMDHPLDPGYQEAADRRRAAGEPTSRGLRSPVLVVTAVLIGVLLVVAAQTLRLPQDAADRERDQLIGQIHSQQSAIDRKSGAISGLQAEISASQRKVLDQGEGPSLVDQLARTEQAAGAVAVHGPGLELTLDDARTDAGVGEDDKNGSGEEQSSVTSTDLQILTNGLWQAGAEAISINGQRLTSTSSIRFAGPAITVDFRPISRPYVVSVVGEPVQMRKRFEAGPSGSYLKSLPSQFDLQVKMTNKGDVQIPASASSLLQYAKPSPSTTASPSTTQKETP